MNQTLPKNNKYCEELKKTINFFELHIKNNDKYILNPRREEPFINLNLIYLNYYYIQI